MNKKNAIVKADTSISEAMSILDEKLKAIGDIAESNYVTSGKFDNYSIKEETNIAILVQAHASLVAREAAYNASADAISKEHGIDIPVFKIAGYEAKDFLKDISFRIKVLNSKEKADELKAIKAELADLMDKNDKKALIFERLAKLS